MAIAISGDSEASLLHAEPFNNEDELQACLERIPYLLMIESEPRIAAVQREVVLPSAGSLDLLLIDEQAVPIAVEVKLNRNSQSRREVVAQAFDYVSDLTQLTVDELDDIVDGALLNTLDELDKGNSAIDLRKQCGTNLRAGRIKVIVAVDEANEGLERIVRYINDHSDLDVRLIAISKYNNGSIYVPRVLVSGGKEMSLHSRLKRRHQTCDPIFAAVVTAYDEKASEILRTRGRAKNYRQIRPDNWPSTLHYEFFNYQDEIRTEIHLESDDVKYLFAVLSKLHGAELLPDVALTWDPRWSKRRGRLFARFGKDEQPETVAKAMDELIAKTRDALQKMLDNMGQQVNTPDE